MRSTFVLELESKPTEYETFNVNSGHEGAGGQEEKECQAFRNEGHGSRQLTIETVSTCMERGERERECEHPQG